MTTNAIQAECLLAGATKSHELNGFSGARIILLTSDGRHWIVRKAARQVHQNQRLRSQAVKQIAFAETVHGVLKTPTVIGDGEADGLYYFDMEFIRGTDGATFLRRAPYAEVEQFTDRLVKYLKLAAQTSPLHTSRHASFFDALFAKCCEVQQATHLIDCETMSQLFLLLNRMRNIDGLTATLCHGDLTLQNLVIDDGGDVWVFDLLDAPYEHYWQDIAKLHQDLSGGWFRLQQAPIAQCVLNFVSDRVLAAAQELHPAYPQIHALLLACTFVRILPYASTSEQRQFILERIGHFARLADSAKIS